MSIVIISKQSGKELSQRKLESYEKFRRVIQWGRKYPINFCERFMGIELLDLQKYMIAESWTRQFILWLVCRNGGKSTDIAIYAMLRSLLIPFNTSYFLGNTGEQAKETFSKLEKIAKREIESFAGTTELFINEVRVDGTTGEGFTHSPASFKVPLFNGSEIFTLNSDVINIKGKRGNVFFDESAWFPEELFVQAENFANQNENFKLGGKINLLTEPKNFPRQLIYASSASDTDSGFYKKARMFTIKMLMGDPNYFVCDFDIDAILGATVNGQELPVPLISRDKVAKQMADNPEKGQRELYNHFSADSHEGQILTRRELSQHTKQYLPIMRNEDGLHQFMLSWDSARINDNSVIEAAELVNDPEKGYMIRLAVVNSLVDIGTKNKTPLILPEQVNEFKKMLLTYNGSDSGKLDYENIDSVMGDAGAAGQLIGGVSDYLLDEWVGADGRKHKGLIDTSHKANEASKSRYPNAVDKMILVDPKGNRNLIFQAIEDMVKLGVVEFPVNYDEGKEYLTFIQGDGTETRHDLTVEEQIALANIELLKTEIVTMCKYTSGGNVSYDFPPDKRTKMHDDRVFAFGLLCWRLAQLRRNQIVKRDPPKRSIDDAPVTVSAVDY